MMNYARSLFIFSSKAACKRGLLSAVLSVAPFTGLFSTEYKPWFGNIYQIELRSSYTYNWYNQVDTFDGTIDYSSTDHFANFSVGVSPVNNWYGELELMTADTNQECLNLAHFRMTARYRISNEDIGDPFSSTAGLSLTFPSIHSRKDISLFYHGAFEGLLHYAIGKEFYYCDDDDWTSRWWIVGKFGLATDSYAWVGFDANVETTFLECHRFGIFIDGEAGLGNHRLVLDGFNTYGDIQYRTLDLGARYRYDIPYWGYIQLEYANRVAERFCPENVHHFELSVYYPLNL